ncbi:type I 3-dehydroquinate dehydratase [Bacillus canaveralius]|uniref:3-dehydroquinate dehydratase n=1 Tax=Bacillus canaveralius TaxID=1403243 RepID=A0A2N5GN47_9BACI|nr:MULTISPECIES: type I 3-dehydroquinate dehydratase [Bacillus]PLR83640.1 type I 3-dehydroquinate dehydratase [Bacillus canaveralius]PLR86919.1 type I 3-dehydroquinate dehydratase [Bacillus sp. V33-4]PLR94426.1 type I 3-dehydroquinate dehydratase [Bacillus canaveralius]RSK53283.1 type I 3-dehydroquinate dehydratase [Bacillus canaveralius]
MIKTVTVKGITIGEGAPKICVPMVGETLSQLMEEAESLSTLDLDVVEWRVDFFEDVEDIDKVTSALRKIRAILPKTPLIFTFRSAKEGGEKEVSSAFYQDLNKAVVKTGLVDIIDVELFNDEKDIKILIDAAHTNNTYTIISNHDFDKTPPKEEIVSRLRKAQQLGGDLPKIAVMPTSPADVLVLLEATYTMTEKYADRPIITMSMAGQGVISRLAGEVFGSAMTFGAAKKASAPGQVAVSELRNVLSLLHSNL